MRLRLQHLDQASKIESIENRIDTDIGDKLEVLLKNRSVLEEKIKKLEASSALNIADSLQRDKLILDISMFYPSITNMEYAQDTIPSLTVTSSKKKAEMLSSADKAKLERYIRSRTGNDTINIIFR
ncbi:MAG: hypothetical protein WC139_07610 [Candidatus Kapaibacterium sp.]